MILDFVRQVKMKKFICFIIVIIVCSIAFADENLSTEMDKIPIKKGCFYASLSPIVMHGIYLGYGWTKIDSNSITENIVVLHAKLFLVMATTGISIRVNHFGNLSRKGFYYIINAGVDYGVSTGGFDPGGSGGKEEYFVFPNIALGGGYSFKIGKNSFFRISLDVGLKFLASNLYLSFIF